MSRFSIAGVELADIGYYITLPRSIERQKHLSSQIKRYNCTNLNKVNGIIIQGDLQLASCTDSHLRILNQFLESEYSTIFVGEDDLEIRDLTFHPAVYVGEAKFDNRIHNSLQRIKHDLDNIDWDIVMLGCQPRAGVVPVTETLSTVSESCGSWAYIINKRGAKYIVDNCNWARDRYAIDNWLCKAGHDTGLHVYISNELIIHHTSNKFISEIQPAVGVTNYGNMIEGYYRESLEHFYVNSSFLTKIIERELTINLCVGSIDLDTDICQYLADIVKSIRPYRLQYCDFVFSWDAKTSTEGEQFEKFKFLINRDFAHVRGTSFSYIINNHLNNINDIIKTPLLINVYPEYIYDDNIDQNDFNIICNNMEEFNADTFIEIMNIQHPKNIPPPTVIKQY